MRYILINIIMFVRLAYGLYSKISNNKIITAIAKVYCTCFLIVVIYFNIQSLGRVSEEWRGYFHYLTIIYVSICMAALISNGENFYQYVSDLDTVSDIGQEKGILSFLIFVLILFYSFVKLYALFVSYDERYVIHLVCYWIISTATLLSHTTIIMVFNILWSRMRALRMRMERFFTFAEGFDEEQSQVETRSLEENLNIYKRLVDNLKHCGNASKFLIVLNFPCYLKCAAQFAIDIGNETKIELDNFIMVIYAIEILLRLVLPLVPAILCELVTAEVDKIKLHLIKATYIVQNKMLSLKIYDGIKFLEVVPYRYSVWRFFYLDLSMTVGLITYCTNYVITVLQFRKMYT